MNVNTQLKLAIIQAMTTYPMTKYKAERPKESPQMNKAATP